VPDLEDDCILMASLDKLAQRAFLSRAGVAGVVRSTSAVEAPFANAGAAEVVVPMNQRRSRQLHTEASLRRD
jgi:hypothetical protein